MKKRNAIIFVDGSNFYHNSKSIIEKPGNLDFQKIGKLISTKYDLDLKQIRYYNSIPDISDGAEVYHKHMEFLDRLKKENILVKTRKLKKIKQLDIKIEKGIDVMIAADMIRETLVKKECEVCILISGDADFIPAMEIIKEVGYEIGRAHV